MRWNPIPVRFFALLLLILSQCSQSFGDQLDRSIKERSPQDASQDRGRNSCRNPTVRREWRKLSRDERLDYIGAVKCLMAKPAIGKSTYPALKSRYDDFVAMHVNATNFGIHFSGIFPPWHRYQLHLYEQALRDDCRYRGSIPYWDWTLDTGDAWNTSPLFDRRTGFGGNGFNSTPPPPGPGGIPGGLTEVIGGCVIDGPFANITLVLGPGNNFTGGSRCLVRNFNAPTIAASCPYDIAIKPLFTAQNYSMAEPIIEGAAHNCGHGGVAGEMFNIWSSTNDPLFYLHHGSIDRMWAIWQGRNRTRLRDMGNPIFPNGSFVFPTGPPGTPPSLPPGFPPISTENITLETTLWGGYHGPNVRVKAVMDTQNADSDGVLCYRYD